MRKILLGILLAGCLLGLPVCADQSVNSNIAHRPYRLLVAQFSTNTNMFCTADPSPDGTPLTETSATGMSGGQGTVTVLLTNGFTAPVTLTAYFWLPDNKTAANKCWTRLGPNSSFYSVSVDTHYATAAFVAPVNTPYIIMSSAAVTGPVYVDTPIDPANNNSATGY